MLDRVAVPDREGIVPWLALTLPDQEGTSLVACLEELLFCVSSFDATKEPPDEGGRERRRKGGRERGVGGMEEGEREGG